MAVKIFASLGLPIREKTSLAQSAMPNFAPLYSQPQCPNPSPPHSQESQVMHQARPMPPTPTPGIPSSPSLGPLYRTVQWAPYDPRPPSSAPETYSERSELPVVSLSQMLPPRRTLPFPSKNTKAPPSDSEVTTVLSSQAMVVDLPVAVVATKKRKPRTKTTQVKKAVAPKRVRGRQTTEKNATFQPLSLNEIATNPETIYVPATPEVVPSSRNNVSPISLSSSKRPTDDHYGTTSPESAEPRKRPKTANHLQPFADNVEPAEFMSRLDTWVREYHQTLPAPKPPAPVSPSATASDTLALYAAQPKEARMAAIDELICECLEDPSFGKLVEDVEDSWKRIGLGF